MGEMSEPRCEGPFLPRGILPEGRAETLFGGLGAPAPASRAAMSYCIRSRLLTNGELLEKPKKNPRRSSHVSVCRARGTSVRRPKFASPHHPFEAGRLQASLFLASEWEWYLERGPSRFCGIYHIKEERSRTFKSFLLPGILCDGQN